MCELELDILKVCHCQHAENEVSRSRLSTLEPEQDKHTDRHIQIDTHDRKHAAFAGDNYKSIEVNYSYNVCGGCSSTQ